MTTASRIIARAETFGIKSKIWQKGAILRIYAQVDRKDMSVYLHLDGAADEVTGAAFHVRCSTPQHRNWIAAQEREYAEIFIGLFHAYVVELYGDAGEIVGYGQDITDMIKKSRAWAAARLAPDQDDEADA